jgi:hypothetical protein
VGKLAAPDDLEQQVHAGGFRPLPVSIAHGVVASELAATVTILPTTC